MTNCLQYWLVKGIDDKIDAANTTSIKIDWWPKLHWLNLKFDSIPQLNQYNNK